MTHQFRAGDKVRCVDASDTRGYLVEGQVYTVANVLGVIGGVLDGAFVLEGLKQSWFPHRFELVSFKLPEPDTHAARKATPIATGVLDYFPLALAEVARVSKAGNDQHNPGQPLHWAKGKSTDHADSLVRHLLDRGTMDTDGQRHTAKVAWRALALLQTELENAK